MTAVVTRVGDRLDEVVGGSARRTVVLVLAGVLGLQAADTGAIGALAAPIEGAFKVGNTDIGLLVAVTTLVGAVATIPFGVLTDRVGRSRLLQWSVVAWVAATVLSAVAVDYPMLLLSRLALGAVVAAAGPAVASLVGDLFPAGERGRLYGYVLTGELVGAGVGILVAGLVSSVLDWRAAIGVLALPGIALVWALARHLPEPARGGQAHLEVGDDHIVTEGDARAGRAHEPSEAEEPPIVAVQAEEAGARPAPGTVISSPDLDLWQAIRFILRVRTNDWLILASGLGYFFFGGLETFATLYFRERFGIGQGLASVLFVVVAAGALVGTLAAGRIADRGIAGGHTAARLTVGGVAFLVTAALFVPGVLMTSLVVALPLFVVAAVAVGGTNPPVDAARLDVMPSELWGRAEAVRTALRQVLQGLAPLAVGALSQVFGARGAGFAAGVGTAQSAPGGGALAEALAVCTIPLAGAGLLLLAGRRHYLRDAVAAARSARAMAA
ncbi:MAG TPA: MFS transporter [Acidimicrobiales bacterium]|nr:MFS transporter [Acidimicrobiales bacterium]